MNALLLWAVQALFGSMLVMLVVLAVRVPARRMFGPQIGFALWALPVLRLLLPPLPTAIAPADVGARIVLAAGGGIAHTTSVAGDAVVSLSVVLPLCWAVGAVVLLGLHAVRHARFCRHMVRQARGIGVHGAVCIIATDVDSPIAFGVWRRYVAVPRDFAARYDAAERALALAHELAHHRRGDLLANWIALGMLSLHWVDPIAWIAFRAFRDDQEFAVDAHVLDGRGAALRHRYARVLVKAAGVAIAPASALHPRFNVKGRLVMLSHNPVSIRRIRMGGVAVVLLAGTVLAATASGSDVTPSSGQARTIIVRPGASGTYTLIVGGTEVAPGAALPNGVSLPADFDGANGCDLSATAAPIAAVIKGENGARTYSYACVGAGTPTVRAALDTGLASLKTLRATVAAQHQPSFPASERKEALGAIDYSIAEVAGALRK